MPELFSAPELINIAIREEVTGATYYRALAEQTDSEALADFATNVAKMEDEHADKFRKLLEDVGDYTPKGEAYQGEYQDYLAYLLEGKIFPMGEEGREMAAEQKSDKEAIETAQDLEKNTLLLYQELLQFVPESQRHVLEGIMDEERLHLTQFTKFKEENF
jgi:rubrerythrin